MENNFTIQIKKKYSENIYIQYDSLYNNYELGTNVDNSRMIFEKFANKIIEGQIYIVLPTEKSMNMIMSENGSFCLGFENDKKINFENYLELLDEQGALSYIIEFKYDVILNSIHKDLLNKIKNYACQEYFKKLKKEPEKIYIKLSSEGAKNIITNHEPDKDVMMYFYDIHYDKKNINKKIDDLTNSFLKINPNFNIDFNFEMGSDKNNEIYFEKINDEQELTEISHDDVYQDLDEIQDTQNTNDTQYEEIEEQKYFENLFNELNRDYFIEENYDEEFTNNKHNKEDDEEERNYIMTDINE